MESPISIANRFQELFLDGKWIANTNYQELLLSINFNQATTKIHSLNTIAELTFHVNYYVEGLVFYFETGNLNIRDKFSFDSPMISSEEDWNNLRTKFMTNAMKFIEHIHSFTNEDLEKVFVNEKYGTYRRNIEAMIEHGYYHLGQISLIKKMVLEK